MKPHYKPILAAQSNLFEVMLKQDFNYPWHYHPEFQLTYIIRNQGMRYVGTSIEESYDDDLVLLGANMPHCWTNTENKSPSTSGIVVYLKEGFMDKNWMQSYEFEAINKLLNLSRKGIMFHKDVALRLKKKCLNLIQLPPFERFMTLLEILQELSQTKDYHYLCEQGVYCEPAPGHHERINTVLTYVEENYKEKISLADVASRVYMTEEYFSRFFSKAMNKSFFRYLNEYKINKACKMLIETDRSISEICYTSGFESIPFFYRQFKKFKGCQPKKYRTIYQDALGG